jgi:hypothetical protein
MSGGALHKAWQRARSQRLLEWLALLAPWAAVAGVLAWRLAGAAPALVVLAIAVVAMVAAAASTLGSLDQAWVVRRLDARADMEDSADLLFAPPQALTPLQGLQHARLQQRLSASAPELALPWRWRRLLLSLTLAAAAGAALAWWPAQPVAAVPPATVESPRAQPAGFTVISGRRLQLHPPAYTAQPPTQSASLEARAPVGTQLQWTLRFAPQPRAAALAFHDGRRVALQRDGEDWRGSHVLQRSALYRIVLEGAPPLQDRRAHRLDAIVDRPPQVRVLQPEQSLTLLQAGQTRWPLAFTAQDDYGVAAVAQLRVVLAQGSGENIAFKESLLTLAGSGPATARHFSRTLDPAALGMAVGDDLIVQLIVRDNRSPGPQEARSPSLILRWPPDLGSEAGGLDGMVKKTLPAYFRSQRQIIIDAEALLKQKRRLPAEGFATRSDAIGVDQRILRLRYGQFLGEEAEGAPKAPPRADASTAADPTAPATPAATTTQADDDHADHVGEETAPAAGFGREADVLAEFGHTHDQAEAATLLDPQTRATLKAALDQMWQSELHLRQGRPELALPFAYKALGFIKQVQQAERVYLARVGPDLPPIDPGRRLSGDRAGISPAEVKVAAATAPDPAPVRAWQALGEPSSAAADAQVLQQLERWLGDHPMEIDDPLAFAAALDRVRNEPACAACRGQLRALLWTALARPPAQVQRRPPADQAGRRYLDALEAAREARP